jgi:acetolactate decarboxylase
MRKLRLASLVLLPLGCAGSKTAVQAPPVQAASAESPAKTPPEAIYQVSTLGNLLAGDYSGKARLSELREQGNFGIGTFDRLDGEMIYLNGQLFQIKADGVASQVQEDLTTPFAAVTFFEADQTTELKQSLDLKGLTGILDSLRTNPNAFYAIKIEGTFKSVKTRSVPPQSEPFPPLEEVMKTQPTFDFKKVDGTLVGFWFPESFQGVGVSGYHFHFLTADQYKGGHLLEVVTKKVVISVDETRHFSLRL